MANKKINQLVSKTAILSTDIFGIGDATTGQLFKKTIAELQAAIGGAVISVNGLVGTVVLDTDDIQELATPTNKYFTDARARGAISLTVTGNSGASTYSSGTGVLNVPTYTLAGLGGITATFLSGTSGISYNSTTGVISYSGTVYTDASIRALLSGSTGISYNSTTGAISYSGTVYTDSSVRALISLTTTGTSGASTYNNTTGVINVPNYTLAGLGGITLGSLSGGTGITYNNTTGAINYSGTVYTDASIRALISASGSVSYNSTTGVVSLSGGNLTEATSSVLTITGGTGAVIGSGTSIQVKQATTSVSGFLSSTDWTTFNNKQATISLTTTGTSGAATFASNVLNIPNYGSALSGYLPLTGGTLTGALGGTSATFSLGIIFGANNRGFIREPAGDVEIGGSAGAALKLYANNVEYAKLAPSTGFTTTLSFGGTSASFSSTVIATSYVEGSYFQISSAPATSGGVRLGTQVAIRARNVANTANIPLIESSAADKVSIDSGGAGTILGGALSGTSATFSSSITSDDLILTAGTLFGAGNTGFSNRLSDTTLYLQMPATGFNITDNALNTRFILSSSGAATFTGGGIVNIYGTSATNNSLQGYLDLRDGNGNELAIIRGYRGAGGNSGILKIYTGVQAATLALTIDENQAATFSSSIGTTALNMNNMASLGSVGGGAIYLPYNAVVMFRSTDGATAKGNIRGDNSSNLLLNSDNAANILLGTTTDNGERLYVSGTIRATGTITANSDIRIKNNITKIENALEKVGQISGYTYNTNYDDKRHGGVIAQEIDKVFPEIVNTGNDGLMGVEYGNISALLIEAIKEQNTKIKNLETLLASK